MSTQDTTDIIMRELITIDPRFAEKEVEVRALISLLTLKKPTITINEDFVRDLRARLVEQHTFPIRSPYHRVNWWAVHLAPIGALAILLLILMPDELRYREEMVPTQEMNLEERMQMDVTDDTSFTRDVPSAKFAPDSSGETGEVRDSSRVMENEAVHLPSPDRFELGTQQGGVSIIVASVTLTQPGYIIIHRFGDQGIGPVVGISPLQNIGTTVGVPIYLRNASHFGEEYYATLYHDNGNSVFSLSDDTPVIDPVVGAPVSVLFTIGSVRTP